MSTTIREVRSNKMVFNILTPKGFFSLTDMTAENESNAPDDNYAEFNNTPPLRNLPTQTAEIGQSVLPLGRTVITANAQNILSTHDIHTALSRHQRGDWGETCPEDWKSNDWSLKNGERILSVYKSEEDEKFWIITERDRSATTVLMPEDY
jgi:hypothetical protein